MNLRAVAFLLAFVPFLVVAQEPASRSALYPPNAETKAVLLANCPKGMAQADWLKLMQQPVNASLYPLRITQAMLDTIDPGKLDLRFRYVMMRDRGVQAGPTLR